MRLYKPNTGPYNYIYAKLIITGFGDPKRIAQHPKESSSKYLIKRNKFSQNQSNHNKG